MRTCPTTAWFERLEERRLLATVPAGFADAAVATGLDHPTAMAMTPDGRMFITQQGGAMRVVKNGALLPGSALTVTTTFNGERGLLGIAVDPDFATTNHIFVYYTATSPTIHNRLSRFTMSGDSVVAGSEFVLADFPTLSSATNHNGGALSFGGDGKLYVAIGENANPSLAQQVNTTFGKMLRFNKDGTIPSDNPFFATNTGLNRSVWASGLRNPYTFAVQPGTGRMFINDVGQNSWEEINEGGAGRNFGWPGTEGDFVQSSFPSFTRPVYSYSHAAGGIAIAGGAFYNPGFNQFPSTYHGAYFFGDFGNQRIYFINPNSPPSASTAPTFATGAFQIVDIDVAPDGTLYYLQRKANGTSGANGRLGRVQFTANLAPSVSTPPQSQTVTEGQPVTFSVEANGVPTLRYQWQRNGSDISGATLPTYTLPTTTLDDNGATFRVRITNDFGTVTSAAATLGVTANQAPIPVITSPLAGTTFGGGQSFTVSGTASDPEDGPLASRDLAWQVDYITGSVVRPFVPLTAGSGGEFTVPTITPFTTADVKYRVMLYATDSLGRTAMVSRDLDPRLTTMTLRTIPAGLTLTLDGQPVTDGSAIVGVEGIERTLGAAAIQQLGGVPGWYAWQYWQHGGAREQAISTPVDDRTYTAHFGQRGSRSGMLSPPALPLTERPTLTSVVPPRVFATVLADDE
jgi:glucose/arabinose dehydrogenase